MCGHVQTLKGLTEGDALLGNSLCNDIMSLFVQSEAISQLQVLFLAFLEHQSIFAEAENGRQGGIGS